MAPHEPLAGVFEKRLIRLVERELEGNTRAGITNGCAMVEEL